MIYLPPKFKKRQKLKIITALKFGTLLPGIEISILNKIFKNLQKTVE